MRLVSTASQGAITDGQKLEPGCLRNSISSGVLGAAERGIAVREAAEATHDVAVSERPAMRVGGLRKGIERPAQLAGALLVGERLAVLERQVGEHALDRQQVAVPALRDEMLCRLQGKGVGRERPRRSPR